MPEFKEKPVDLYQSDERNVPFRAIAAIGYWVLFGVTALYFGFPFGMPWETGGDTFNFLFCLFIGIQTAQMFPVFWGIHCMKREKGWRRNLWLFYTVISGVTYAFNFEYCLVSLAVAMNG